MRFVWCKSLPRSGHNLLTRLLRLYFRPHIGYCEPYDGRCCHKQPCERPARYRLHKSHDFKLTDAKVEEGCLIQYRAPIPAIHSHYILNCEHLGQQTSVQGFARFAETNTPYYAGFFLKWVSHPRPQDLVISFEDLIANTDPVLRQAIRFVRQSKRPIFGTKRLQRHKMTPRPPAPLVFLTPEIESQIGAKLYQMCGSAAKKWLAVDSKI